MALWFEIVVQKSSYSVLYSVQCLVIFWQFRKTVIYRSNE